MFEINKRITLAIIVILAFVVYWFYFRVEGFDNKEACTLLRKNQKIVVKTMDAIPTNDIDTRDAINHGINYHDMQTRDIVLGDEKGSWCDRLSKDELAEVQKAIEEQVNTEVQLFDGGDLMDMAEEQSNLDGIAYAGADKYDSEYMSV